MHVIDLVAKLSHSKMCTLKINPPNRTSVNQIRPAIFLIKSTLLEDCKTISWGITMIGQRNYSSGGKSVIIG